MVNVTSTAAALAAATDYYMATVFVESSESSNNGSSISVLPIAKGDAGTFLTFYHHNYTVSAGEVSQYFDTIYGDDYVYGQQNNSLVASTNNLTTLVEVKDSYFTINGSADVFYACDSMPWDPKGDLTKDYNGVAIYSDNAPHGCSPIKIKVNPLSESADPADITSVGNSSSSAASSTLSKSASASSVAASSVAASSTTRSSSVSTATSTAAASSSSETHKNHSSKSKIGIVAIMLALMCI